MIQGGASQIIGAELINATTGAAFVGTVTCYVTVDNGTQAIGATGSGICVSKGNGLYQYPPTATETNGKLITFTFIGTGAIPVSVEVATVTAAQAAAIVTGGGGTVLSVTDLLTLALKRINIVQPGQAAQGNDLQDGFTLANLWLDSLATERLMIPFILSTTFTIDSTHGTPSNPYTVGTGGLINVATPTFIDHVTYTNNAVTPVVEMPLTPLTPDAYSLIPIKTQTSALPGSWYYQPTYAGGFGSLYLWAVPTQASLTGTIYAPAAIAQFTSLTQTVVVPVGYQRFLVDGLAVHFGQTWRDGLLVDPGLAQSVREAKENLQTKNLVMADMAVDPALVRQTGWRSNIYAGWP